MTGMRRQVEEAPVLRDHLAGKGKAPSVLARETREERGARPSGADLHRLKQQPQAGVECARWWCNRFAGSRSRKGLIERIAARLDWRTMAVLAMRGDRQKHREGMGKP